MNVVVDASAAVEYLLRTPLGRSVASRMEAADLFAPELLDAEVLSILRGVVLGRKLAPKRAEQALDDLCEWPLERVSNRVLVVDAWRFRSNVSAYDALYLAAARLHEATVLTADGPLSRAPSLGVVVENVRG